MRFFEVSYSNPLSGKITIPGSKNSSLGLLAACCLCEDTIILNNIPNILDFKFIKDIGNDIGLNIVRNKNKVIVDPSKIHSAIIDPKKASYYRASYYFVGALLNKFKKVSIGYPGGDNFGSRPIDQHIKGLEALGAKFTFFNDYYVVEAEKLAGASIYFDMITSGATINVLLGAVKAEGRTILRNAARDPEVVDIAIFLNKMGARIKGAGTDTIIIDGVETLTGGNHTVIPDRLIAGAFLMSAGITGGNVTVKDIIPEHLENCTAKLMETGLIIEEGESHMTAVGVESLRAIKVKADMYPGFATDLQQPLTAMLTKASGNSIIVDKVYPGRFNHCMQLNRMGADIVVRGDGSALIKGNQTLRGNWVHATDVRAGICLILAGLVAEGTTYITGVEHIERGYADIVSAFASIGANIKLNESNDVNANIDSNYLVSKG